MQTVCFVCNERTVHNNLPSVVFQDKDFVTKQEANQMHMVLKVHRLEETVQRFQTAIILMLQALPCIHAVLG